MIPFLVSALIFMALGWCVRNGPVLSMRESMARIDIREGKRLLREAAQAAEALAVSRAELEALREETYAKAAEAQAALDQALAQAVVAQQTLRVVQAVREQTVQIMSKRWDEPVADVADAAEPVSVPPAQSEPDAKPKTRERFAAKPRKASAKAGAAAELAEVA